MRIIDRDSRLPVTRRVMIPTVRDKQKTLEVDLFESDDDDIIDAGFLGTVVYDAIGAAPAGEAKVVVDLSLDVDRVLRVSSPEPGREGEMFEWPVAGHTQRKNGATSEPTLHVAQALPKEGDSAESSAETVAKRR